MGRRIGKRALRVLSEHRVGWGGQIGMAPASSKTERRVFLMKGILGVCVVVAMLATPAMAALIDFNAPVYHDGAIAGQDGWVATGDTSGILVSDTATNGWMHVETGAGTSVVWVTRPYATPIGPGADGHILVSVDVTNVQNIAGQALRLEFADSSGSEFARLEVFGNGVRARGPGGGTAGTAYSIAQGVTKTIWIDIDDNTNNAYFYHDSISSGNLLAGANPLAYNTTSTEISRLSLEAANVASKWSCYVDNINVTPEPASLILLALGGLLLRRR